MSNHIVLVDQDNLKNKIYTIRGLKVMLDNDLAALYEVETKYLNKAVKRNIERFPERFMFQLTAQEYNHLRSQIATIKKKQNWKSQNEMSSYEEHGRIQNNSLLKDSLRFQNGTLEKGRGMHKKYMPYVFTEQGVSMLSGVLKSDIAVNVSIQIIDAFVSMRRFISTNAEIFMRLDTVERKQIESQIKTDKNFERVFEAIEDKDFVKKQGIFFDGQIFDAYVFVSDLIRSAKESIVLVDNFVDDSVFTLFTKRNKNVDVVIYTKNITKQMMLDLDKFNSQYDNIQIKQFTKSHDRFLIIDEKHFYHFGASLKDLGKRWFAFSKFDRNVFEIIERLKQK